MRPDKKLGTGPYDMAKKIGGFCTEDAPVFDGDSPCRYPFPRAYSDFSVPPLTFSNPADYNDIESDDAQRLDDVRRALAEGDDDDRERDTRPDVSGAPFHIAATGWVRAARRTGERDERTADRLRLVRPRVTETSPPEVKMCAASTDAQIEVPMDDPAVQSIPARYKAPVQAGRYRLTVRAGTGSLRIIAAWQALGCEACHASHVRIRIDRRHHFEEMTFTFAAVSPDTLVDMVGRLVRLPWVLDACFYA